LFAALSIKPALESYAKPKLPPVAVLGFGILAASTASLFIRYAQQDIPSLVIAAYRLSLATLLLTPVVLTRYRKELMCLTARQVLLLCISGVFLAFHFAAWITSLQYTTVASSVVLVTTTPLWVAFLSPIILKEQPGKAIWIGLLIALAGGTVVSLGQSCTVQIGHLHCPPFAEFVRAENFIGNLLALVGAWMATGYMLIGRRLRSSLALTSYIYVVYGVAAVALLLMVAMTGEKMVGYSPQSYLFCLALALIPQLFGHSAYNWALKYVSAVYVSVSLLGEPIGSTILALLFLNETPTFLELGGGVLILAGIYLVTRNNP
jgi:drug/metabolite transporter (DMT)-like permease